MLPDAMLIWVVDVQVLRSVCTCMVELNGDDGRLELVLMIKSLKR
jgi:hypothetical protein